MPLDLQEIIEDGAEVGAFVGKLQSAVAALPKPPAVLTASDVCAVIASAAPECGALIDKIRADIAD